MRNLFTLNLLPFYDASGDPGAPAPGADASPAAIPQAPAVAQPATSAVAPHAPATSGVPDGYVPSYRLREAREAAERQAGESYNRQLAEIRAEAERYKSQVQALVGVTPQQHTEADSIKSQFFNLFPWAKKMEDRFGDFESMLEKAGDLEAQNQHYWTSYGKQTMDRLFAHAQESLGAPLTEEGKRQLHASFTGFVSSSPELTARYSSDPSIVEDFWKQFTSSFIDPVRRVAAAGVAQRTPGALPQDSPGGAPRVGGAPQPANLDDRVALAWAQYNKGGL